MRPAIHDGEPVGHGERLLLVVRDQQEGDADAALQGLEFDAHLLAQLGIERGQRLVEQQHVGLEDQGAGERDALPFAAGKLRGTAVLLAGEADEFEHVADAAVDVAWRRGA